MSSWHEVPLGDVCELKRGYDLPNGVRRPGSVRVVSSSGPTGWHDEAKVAAPGVVTGRYGTLGQVFYLTEDFWPLNTSLYVRDFKGNDPRFVATLLRSMNLAQYDGAAAVPGLNRNQLHTVRVSVPDLPAQQAIADVVEAFDDLIENNRRRVEVLEEMARTIFCEWFVKFRYPGHEGVPLVDSPLGPIPEGWEAGAVRDASAVVVRGISPKYAEDGQWVVLNQRCIRDGRVSFHPSRRQERGVSDTKRIRFGDVLINSTGVGTLGRVAMYRGPSEGVTVDSHVTIARPAERFLNPWYSMSLLSKQGEIERLGTGATGQAELRKSDIEALDLVRPVTAAIDAFASVVAPLLSQVDVLLAESETLGALHDLLLPKLVTGQIDVSALDLDALIEGRVA